MVDKKIIIIFIILIVLIIIGIVIGTIVYEDRNSGGNNNGGNNNGGNNNGGNNNGCENLNFTLENNMQRQADGDSYLYYWATKNGKIFKQNGEEIKGQINRGD